MSEHEKLAYRVNEACEVAGVGRTTLYAEISAGRLEARKVGGRTLIMADELRRWLDGLPVLPVKLAEPSAATSASVRGHSPKYH